MLIVRMEQPSPVLADKYSNVVELGDFYVSVIKDKKNTAIIIKFLTENFPLKQFNFLKRVKNNRNKGDNLQVLLRKKEDVTSCNTKMTIESVLGDGSSISEYLGSPFLVKVPLTPPLTRKQLDEACLNWPCTFHEDKQISRLLSGKYFSDTELGTIKRHMTKAVELARISKSKNQEPIGAVIVDPVHDRVKAASHDLRRGLNHLHHAVMLSIDLVARSQGGGMWNIKDEDFYFDETEQTKVSTDKETKTGPYLCTGYDIYVSQEPCIMCAMALVHSRISRVFYGSEVKEGALGSFYKLHTQDGLNHHYEVFKYALVSECDKLYENS